MKTSHELGVVPKGFCPENASFLVWFIGNSRDFAAIATA